MCSRGRPCSRRVGNPRRVIMRDFAPATPAAIHRRPRCPWAARRGSSHEPAHRRRGREDRPWYLAQDRGQQRQRQIYIDVSCLPYSSDLSATDLLTSALAGEYDKGVTPDRGVWRQKGDGRTEGLQSASAVVDHETRTYEEAAQDGQARPRMALSDSCAALDGVLLHLDHCQPHCLVTVGMLYAPPGPNELRLKVVSENAIERQAATTVSTRAVNNSPVTYIPCRHPYLVSADRGSRTQSPRANDSVHRLRATTWWTRCSEGQVSRSA